MPMMLGSVSAAASASATSRSDGGTTNTNRLLIVAPSGGKFGSMGCHLRYPAFSGNGSHFHPLSLRVLDISSRSSQGSSSNAVAATNETEGNCLAVSTMRSFCPWVNVRGSKNPTSCLCSEIIVDCWLELIPSSNTKSAIVQTASIATPQITNFPATEWTLNGPRDSHRIPRMQTYVASTQNIKRYAWTTSDTWSVTSLSKIAVTLFPVLAAFALAIWATIDLIRAAWTGVDIRSAHVDLIIVRRQQANLVGNRLAHELHGVLRVHFAENASDHITLPLSQ